jgi:serine/threonine-protein kinase PpkA
MCTNLPKSLLPLLLILLLACGMAQAVRADAMEPLYLKGTDLYQRIITLPGAQLYDDQRVQVGEGGLPVFQAYYLFERNSDAAGREWVHVGESASKPDGWIPASETQEWNLMMVMRYAPQSARARVLFFEENAGDPDKPPHLLREIVQAYDVEEQAKSLLNGIDADQRPKGIVAVEKELPPAESSSYLMPILKFEKGLEFEQSPTQATLLKVASVNADESPPATGQSLAAAKNAIVFVFDTTVSMKPYIEEARRFAAQIYRKLRDQGHQDRVTFGLVGYRGNMDGEPQRSGDGAKEGCPGLEYVFQVHQDLNPDDPPEMLLDSLMQMDVACVPTRDWSEDAVAGLLSAINDLDWETFGVERGIVRWIFLVTDAGALENSESEHPGYTIRETIAPLADQNGVAIWAMHLHTPEAVKANNIELAKQQYQIFGERYFPLKPKGSEPVAEFRELLDTSADAVVKAFDGFAKEQRIEKPEPPKRGQPLTAGDLFTNAIFSAQQRYLGEAAGETAPLFYKAWASDRDLAGDHGPALIPAVFMTKNQLSLLAQLLTKALENVWQGQTGPESFFDDIREISTRMVTDPEREDLKMSELLPAYLQMLPYSSDFLRIDKKYWTESMGVLQQQENLENLRAKVNFYKEIYDDGTKWTASGDEEFALVPLSVLP